MTPSPFDPRAPVAIIGAGVMGTKVAWACARAGLPTRLADVEPGKAQASARRACGWGSARDRAAVERHLLACDRAQLELGDVQLAFENVPELLELKREVLGELSRAIPPAAYIGSNASSLLCSPLAAACRDPARFFCLNFTDPRHQRLVELMSCADTAPATIDFTTCWARHIRMVPIAVRKEQLGYSFNRLWRVIKQECLRQIAEGYSTAADIDRSWMLSFGTDYGPCGLMDQIGLHSVLKVERVYHAHSGESADAPPQFLVDLVEAGHWGEISGRGFYDYPNPAYRQAGFLEGETGA